MNEGGRKIISGCLLFMLPMATEPTAETKSSVRRGGKTRVKLNFSLDVLYFIVRLLTADKAFWEGKEWGEATLLIYVDVMNRRHKPRSGPLCYRRRAWFVARQRLTLYLTNQPILTPPYGTKSVLPPPPPTNPSCAHTIFSMTWKPMGSDLHLFRTVPQNRYLITWLILQELMGR